MIPLSDLHRAIEAVSSLAMARAWAEPLAKAMERFQINSAQRAAAFLAQIAHESQGFTRTEENLSYSGTRLMAVWPGRFPNYASAKPYERAPEKLANYVYANRMGNGPPQSGEGWLYRGRGLLQLTGKDAYVRAGNALGLPLHEQPDRVAREPEIAALTAAWFWSDIDGNDFADDMWFRQLTKAINGGLNGLEDRKRLWRLATKALKGAS